MEVINLFLALVVVLFPFTILIFKHFIASSSLRSSPPLPPGPSRWQFIGNVHQMGKKTHIALANLAKFYGPIMSLKLGTQRLIIGSSPAAATEILKNSDSILSGRYIPHAIPVRNSEAGTRSLGWAPACNEQWKYLRALCRSELFSGKAIDSQACLREKKAEDMVDSVRGMEGKVVKIGEMVFATVFNSLSTVLLSRDFIRLDDNDDDDDDDGDGGMDEEMKELVRGIMEVCSAPNISDLYPIFGALELQGLQRKFVNISDKISAIWTPLIEEKRDRKGSDFSRKQDFLDVFFLFRCLVVSSLNEIDIFPKKKC